jgi:hypothetical protein
VGVGCGGVCDGVWCGGVCDGVCVVWGRGSLFCARTFQGLHSVRLWTPTILIIAICMARVFIKTGSRQATLIKKKACIERPFSLAKQYLHVMPLNHKCIIDFVTTKKESEIDQLTATSTST